MRKLNELKAERASKIAERGAVVEQVKTEERASFNEEEQKKFDDLTDAIRDLDKQIEFARAAATEAKRQAEGAPAIHASAKKEEAREGFSFTSAFRNALNKRPSEVMQELTEKAGSEFERSGLNVTGDFSLPADAIRAQTVTGDSGAKGGAFVATEISEVEPLEPSLTVEQLGANILTGLTGNISLPSSDSFSLDYVGETEDVAESDVNISGPTMSPKRVAGVISLSKKLLMQSSPEVEAYIRRRLNNAINVAVLKGALNGAGGNAPTGLYSLITSNINTVDSAPTHDIIVDLETKIKSADATEQTLAYLSDPALMGKMKTTKIDAGSGQFLFQNGALNGYKYLSTSVAPTLDVGASHPLIFGDWAQLFVGFWGGLNFTVDPYVKAGASQVRIIVELFNDVAVANEKAFAINKLMKLV